MGKPLERASARGLIFGVLSDQIFERLRQESADGRSALGGDYLDLSHGVRWKLHRDILRFHE